MNKNGTIHDIKTKEKSENRKKRESAKCKFCERNVGRDGCLEMCNRHYQMYKRHGDPLHYDKKKGKPGSNGYIRHNYGKALHRTIMENHIGRKLKREEIVHHIDLVKTNNNIENLYLCKNAAEHAKIHHQYNNLRKELGDSITFIFENGVYRADNI
jgi:hypothetical protein